MKRTFNIFFLCTILILITNNSFSSDTKNTIGVKATPIRATMGDTVKIEVQLNNDDISKSNAVKALYLKPTQGKYELSLTPVENQTGLYRGEIILDKNTPKGLYAIHAWTGNERKPSAIGKATFLVGKIVADFFIASIADNENPKKEIEEYLQDIADAGVEKSVYVQANWAPNQFEEEAAWVQSVADSHGWPHAIIGYADLTVDDVRPQLDALKPHRLIGSQHLTARDPEQQRVADLARRSGHRYPHR